MTLKSLLIWASVLLAGCTQLWAQEDKVTELCKIHSVIAELIMKLRQKNADMADVMDKMNGDPHYESLVIEAYQEPLFFSEDMIDSTVQEFKNSIFLECIQTLQAIRDEQSE